MLHFQYYYDQMTENHHHNLEQFPLISPQKHRDAKILGQKKSEIIQQHSQFLHHEVTKLQNFCEHFSKILKQTEGVVQNCDKQCQKFDNEIIKLEMQIKNYEQRQKAHDTESMLMEQIMNLKEKYISTSRKRVSVAQSISVKKLKGLRLQDRGSIANQVFKWIIVAIYRQLQSKYHWDNFKQQVFNIDKGKDFIERLGKVEALHVKIQEKAKTEYFLDNYELIINSKDLQGLSQQIQKVCQIARYFRQCYTLADNLSKLSLKYEKVSRQLFEEAEDHRKSLGRLKAIRQRRKINRNFAELIKMVDKKVRQKIGLYITNIEKGKAFCSDFENFGLSVPSQSLKNKFHNCQCQIF